MSGSESAFVTSLIGERIAGRYIVERVLRAGGMGVVALGRYPELEQEVAIKFMKPEYAAHTVLCARFLREARLAARVKSPHFVRVFDFGRVEPGVPYLVMEMLSGHDLADEIERNGAMPIPTAVDYVLQACVALAEVHGLGIVHRDLKPSNLFLAEAGGTRMLKVLDFGVSKESVGESLTSTGSPVGTPHYMSPEQVRESKLVDVRSDVWSLGVILYELLTTTIPFGGEGQPIGEVYGMIMHTEPTPPRDHAPELPPEIEAVIMKCLRRDPKERFATVGELAEALRPFATAGSISRIEAVHQVLAFERPERIAGGDSPVVEVVLPPVEKRSFSSRAISPASDEKATAASGPSAKRSGGGPIESSEVARATPSAPTRALGARARPDTAMTSTRSSETPELLRMPTPVRKTSSIARIGAVAFVVGIAITAVVFWRSTAPTPPAQTSIASAPTSAPLPSTASSAIAAEPIAKPLPPPSASASASPPTTPTASALPAASSPPSHHHAASPSGPKLAAPPSDLLNDRK
jgi:serine/threonine-protein kinase